MQINYQRVRRVILILLIPIVLIFFSINSTIFSQQIYEKQIPADKIELSNQVIKFLRDNTQSLPDIFTPKEIFHLEDVKALIKNIFLVGWIVSFLSVILFYFEENKLKTLMRGVILTLVLLGILIVATLSFRSFFDIFHQLFFKSGTWMFSQESALINLYPLKFFNMMAVLILFQLLKFCIVGLAILLGIKIYKKFR